MYDYVLSFPWISVVLDNYISVSDFVNCDRGVSIRC
jgi:hypothetical protein